MHIAAIFIQTLNVTLPVFALVFVGIAMRRAGWIDDRFVSAASSFIMVEAMGGDARLAANIVAVTTLAASVTMTAGVFALRVAGVI